MHLLEQPRVNILLLLTLMCLLCVQLASHAQQKNVEMKMTRDVIKLVKGIYTDQPNTIVIGGIPYDGFSETRDSILDIRGWDHFSAQLAHDNDGWPDIKIYVDDELVFDGKLHAGQKAKPIDIPLTGRNTLSFSDNAANHILLKPTLIKGNPTAYLDPMGLKFLVDELADKIEATPGLKSNIDKSTISVATFNVMNIVNPRVGTAAAEDMTTAFINRKFTLLERGQIDLTLSSMGVNDVTKITPDIAKTIQRRTGCKYLVIGNIYDAGGPESFSVILNARLLDLDTGKALIAHRMDVGKIPPLKAKTP